VTNEAQGASSPQVFCKVCAEPSMFFGQTNVLKKYLVRYFRCGTCGFIQTETPFWLEEAYSSAIASQDVGIMQRNILNCELTSAVLNLLFPDISSAIDYGAGHGVFVRLMRDNGFNFYWSDPHATNDYARGFEYKEDSKYDFLTAFEVLEHLADPVTELSKLMSLSDNVFVSTCIVPQRVTGLSDWWYFMPSSGQHISFYTPESLRLLAARFGRSLLSVGPYHLFSKKPKERLLYRVAINPRIAPIVNRIYRRPSLTESDFLTMIR
jgi:Methyltransferase domain